MGTVIAALLLVLAAAFAVRSIIAAKRKGKSFSCGGDCSRCAGGCAEAPGRGEKKDF